MRGIRLSLVAEGLLNLLLQQTAIGRMQFPGIAGLIAPVVRATAQSFLDWPFGFQRHIPLVN
jgi:hypothetical protein